ncbi:MAG: orotidine 5'-phosphate decarboxylase, partial [Candidatus Symbiothrix sp.]|jgi:orotidine-5'-phosphate decarboxylase|nr:orotidine 5'-phosphate decarboxylase [Candidatus Symbiothrix sp.]
LLVPGIGAQGGSLEEVVRYGMNAQCGLLVNSSRQILYADASERFADTARAEAEKVRNEMAKYLA